MGSLLKVLIVGSPTLDYILFNSGTEIRRYGGPGIYDVLASYYLGDNIIPYIVGVVGRETFPTLKIISDYGGVWSGVFYPYNDGLVFRHYYKNMERYTILVGSYSVTPIDLVISEIRRINPDIVIISPVHGEIAPQLPSILYSSSSSPCVFLDIQGFHRVRITDSLLRNPAAFIHASEDEIEGLYNVVDSIIIETNSAGPIHLVSRTDRVFASKALGELKDPTGAGDVFTFLYAVSYCNDYDVNKAVSWANNMTFKILPSLNDLVKRLSSSTVLMERRQHG